MADTNIAFTRYDSSNRRPGVYAEVVAEANTSQRIQRTLILGQVNPATASRPVSTDRLGFQQISTGVADAKAKYGVGSQLALMLATYRQQDTAGEVWELPLADPASGGTAASGSIAIAGTATESGAIYPYIAGTVVPVAVSVGDTAAVVAANLYAALVGGGYPDLPVTASAPAANALSTVTLTARVAGIAGNEIDIRSNYLGASAGEVTPAGLALTTAALSGGTGVPSLPAALANLGVEPFDFVVCPYSDTASLDALKAFFNDTSGRWSWNSMLYGGAFGAIRGTLGALVAAGTARNDAHVSLIGFDNAPEPAWIWAADYAGAAAVSLRADPALPLQTIALNVKAPTPSHRFTDDERGALLYDGISTFKVANDGTVTLERAITTYQRNNAGALDNSYLDVETPYTLQRVVLDMQDYLATTYTRTKLVADGTRIAGGSNMVTSQTVLLSAIARYRGYCADGLCQDAAGFAGEARAQNAGNGLVKLVLPFRLANQLRVIAMQVAFSKP